MPTIVLSGCDEVAEMAASPPDGKFDEEFMTTAGERKGLLVFFKFFGILRFQLFSKIFKWQYSEYISLAH